MLVLLAQIQANFHGADLTGADLESAVLDDADLSDAVLAGAFVNNAQFPGANIKGTDCECIVGLYLCMLSLLTLACIPRVVLLATWTVSHTWLI